MYQPESEWLAVEIDPDRFSVHQQHEACFDTSPHILQRYHRPARVESERYDFELGQSRLMQGRVRL